MGFLCMKLFLFDEACAAFERGDASDKYHDVNWGFCLRTRSPRFSSLMTSPDGNTPDVVTTTESLPPKPPRYRARG